MRRFPKSPEPINSDSMGKITVGYFFKSMPNYSLYLAGLNLNTPLSVGENPMASKATAVEAQTNAPPPPRHNFGKQLLRARVDIRNAIIIISVHYPIE
ncbi:MAG: hypothetical protein QXT13_13300 [Pyrobaculum sp.]